MNDKPLMVQVTDPLHIVWLNEHRDQLDCPQVFFLHDGTCFVVAHEYEAWKSFQSTSLGDE